MTRQPAIKPWAKGVLTLLLVLGYRFLEAAGAQPFVLWVLAGLALLALFQTLAGLIDLIRWNLLLRAMKVPTGLYGELNVPTAKDVGSWGLKPSNEDGNGIPIGGNGKHIIYYDGPAHISVRAPTNAGKTESHAAPVCFALGAHRNIVTTAKGAELAWLTTSYRRDVLKQKVYVINPWRLMHEHNLPCHDFNPIGHLVKYASR